ncbi:MAG: hypothetical protein NC218_02580 [Acetobacter sp.]|nr:hypothetical protein [Acetobacter sp.]
MANIKNKKGITVTSPFKLMSGTPLDARTLVDTIAERDSIVSSNAAYDGLQVYVKSEKCYFCYKNGVWEKQVTASHIDEDLYDDVVTEEKIEFAHFFNNFSANLNDENASVNCNNTYTIAQQNRCGYGGFIGIPPKGSFRKLRMTHYFESFNPVGHTGYHFKLFKIKPPVQWNGFQNNYATVRAAKFDEWAEVVDEVSLPDMDGNLEGSVQLEIVFNKDIVADGQTPYGVLLYSTDESMRLSYYGQGNENLNPHIAEIYHSQKVPFKSIYCGRLYCQRDQSNEGFALGAFVTNCSASDYDSWTEEHTTLGNMWFIPVHLYSAEVLPAKLEHRIADKFGALVSGAVENIEKRIPISALADAQTIQEWSRDDAVISFVEGKYIAFDSGKEGANSAYCCSHYLPVEQGKQHNLFLDKKLTKFLHYAFFDENLSFISGSRSLEADIIPPDGASFIRFSVELKYVSDTTVAEWLPISSTQPYSPRVLLSEKTVLPASAVVLDESSIPAKAITPDKLSFATKYTSYNMFNLHDEDILLDKYVSTVGNIGANTSYVVTGFIPVTEGQTIILCVQTSGMMKAKQIRFLSYYDSNKVALKIGDENCMSSVVPAGVSYVRLSILRIDYDASLADEAYSMIQVSFSGSVQQWKQFGDYYLIPAKALDIDLDAVSKKELHIYLPPEICVAEGITIELYNRQVCLEADDYLVQWIGKYGRQYERKYTIEGSEGLVGEEFDLTCNIIDTAMKVVASAKTKVRVVSATIDDQQLIIPIGDSLTNNKAWLTSVKTLSNSQIMWRGTRGTKDPTLVNGITHEGRSGAGTDWYNKGTMNYTFDQTALSTLTTSGSLDGLVTDKGAVIDPIAANPFWNKETGKFDFDFYCNSKFDGGAGYFKNSIGDEISLTPTGVQIYLGTNGLALDPAAGCTNIRMLVDNIRMSTKGATIPIYVVNTLHRPDQIFNVNADGFSTNTAGEYKFLADVKIQNLEKALYNALKDYKNVFFIPVAVTHDSEYNFPFTEVGVNPRLDTIKVRKYTDCVHPSKAGYEQMADIMFSTIAAHYKDNK